MIEKKSPLLPKVLRLEYTLVKVRVVGWVAVKERAITIEYFSHVGVVIYIHHKTRLKI